jgi:RNA polymerase sigma-70 factor (ECF subfamily)
MGLARGDEIGVRDTSGIGGSPNAGSADSEPLAGEAYLLHAAAVRGFLTRLTRNRAVADDLLHDCFVRYLAEVAAGRTPRHPSAWLHRVAFNLATSRARHDSVAVRRAPELLRRDAVPSPEDQLLERESAGRLEARLSHLTPDARAALLLAALGFSGPEIAVHLGRTPLAIRSLICRARSRLRATVAA